MPFTFSHPAAVVPFAKTRLSLSALVVGSMSPDFIYFVYLKPNGESTHTLSGIFLYCLPAGLLVLFIYHLLVKMPLQSILPCRAPQHGFDLSRPFTLQSMGRLALVAFSVVIGAFTHLAWDAFTHEDGWVLKFLPFLNVTVFDLGFDKVPLTRILHHFSSVAGALGLIAWTRKWAAGLPGKSRSGQNDPEPLFGAKIRTAMLWVSVSVAAGLLYAWTQAHPIQNYDEFRQMMVQALVATGSTFFSITLLYCIFWHMAKRRAPSR
ncbi:MAG: DUF4184 family protein [Desulfobacteraceae bacterium]|nr:MAG: DUF4184 family protein [Desulfobacteraceae bacterium]